MTDKLRVTKHSDKLDQCAWCDPCGQLDPTRAGQSLDAAARAHLRKHPNHQVSMSHVVQASFVVAKDD